MAYRFPFSPYPNCWFRVAFSDELRPGDVKPIHYFGQDLVVFRTQDGTAHVMDAHCPHLGAHLGYGGRIEKNTIRCPFHGWCFDANGRCVEVPYSSKSVPKAQVRTWPVREVNGMIMVYHHELEALPTWDIPTLPECNNPDWLELKRTHWRVRMHAQELAENGIDTSHMPVVHSQAMLEINDRQLEMTGTQLVHRLLPRYQVYFGSKHLGRQVDCKHDLVYHGLGCLLNYVYINEHKITLELIFAFYPTPIDEEYIEIQGVFLMKKVWTKLLTKLLATKITQNFELTINQDIPIWENKIYHTNPLLCEQDEPIRPFRRWATQFYAQS